MVSRPKTLQEVAAETQTYRDFGRNLKDFLHEFTLAKKGGIPLGQSLADEPRFLRDEFAEGRICDAFVAATADFLARISGINTPLWALNEARVLEEPWFSSTWPEVRLLLLRDTPSAFKDKNIFVFDSALKAA
jgi:hypothetical protein